MNAYAFPTAFTIRIGRKIGNVRIGSLADPLTNISSMSACGRKADVRSPGKPRKRGSANGQERTFANNENLLPPHRDGLLSGLRMFNRERMHRFCVVFSDYMVDVFLKLLIVPVALSSPPLLLASLYHEISDCMTVNRP